MGACRMARSRSHERTNQTRTSGIAHTALHRPSIQIQPKNIHSASETQLSPSAPQKNPKTPLQYSKPGIIAYTFQFIHSSPVPHSPIQINQRQPPFPFPLPPPSIPRIRRMDHRDKLPRTFTFRAEGAATGDGLGFVEGGDCGEGRRGRRGRRGGCGGRGAGS